MLLDYDLKFARKFLDLNLTNFSTTDDPELLYNLVFNIWRVVIDSDKARSKLEDLSCQLKELKSLLQSMDSDEFRRLVLDFQIDVHVAQTLRFGDLFWILPVEDQRFLFLFMNVLRWYGDQNVLDDYATLLLYGHQDSQGERVINYYICQCKYPNQLAFQLGETEMDDWIRRADCGRMIVALILIANKVNQNLDSDQGFAKSLFCRKDGKELTYGASLNGLTAILRIGERT